MSGYYVACPRCTNQLYDDGQLAGELVMCPHCTQQFQMPHIHHNDTAEADRVIADFRQSVREYARSRTTHQAVPAEGFDWVVPGYVATVFSLVLFPVCVAGLVIGFINLIRGSIGHGLVQTAIAIGIIALIIHGKIEDANYWSERALTDPMIQQHQDELESETASLRQRLEGIDNDERLRALEQQIREARPDSRLMDISSEQYKAQDQVWNELMSRRQSLRESIAEELRSQSDRRREDIDRRYRRMYDDAASKRNR